MIALHLARADAFRRYGRLASDYMGIDHLASHPRLSIANLLWMCRAGEGDVEQVATDKASRWLGFVEGCMLMRGLIEASPTPLPVSGTQAPEAPLDTIEGVHAHLFARYAGIIHARRLDLTPCSIPGHLARTLQDICDAGRARKLDIDTDCESRVLGFIQGCLAMHGWIDVDEERDVTRPLFHAVYRARSGCAPATIVRTEPD